MTFLESISRAFGSGRGERALDDETVNVPALGDGNATLTTTAR